MRKNRSVSRSLLLLACTAFWYAAQPAAAITSYWILQDANGNWNTPGNWNNGVPTNAGDIAIFTNVLTQARVITIDTAVSLGTLKIGPSGYALSFASGGKITMDSGNTSHAVIQQTGSQQNYAPPQLVMNSDLDINNNGSGYFNLVSTAISGNHDIYINANGASGTPYIGGGNTYIGNLTICSGTLMNSGSGDPFGSVTNGTRTITLYSNSTFRLNGSISLATNRLLVVGTGGGQLNMNSKTLTISRSGQLTGSNSLTITTSGTVAVGGTNDNLTGSVLLNNSATLKLNAGGAINYVPVINMSHAGNIFDVTGKSSGYTVSSNQVLAGIGSISGLVNVASAAVLHPGSYTLPGPVTSPGILTVASGWLNFAGGGTYVWDLAQLKDNAYAPGTTTYSQISVTNGSVSLDGGNLALRFLNGIAAPDSTNAFWKTEHVWTVLTASAPPSGTLTVTGNPSTRSVFFTRVNGNTLELVYRVVRNGTLLSVL